MSDLVAYALAEGVITAFWVGLYRLSRVPWRTAIIISALFGMLGYAMMLTLGPGKLMGFVSACQMFIQVAILAFLAKRQRRSF